MGPFIETAGPFPAPEGGASGTVTSVGLTSTGATITITGSPSPITGAGSWNIEIAGTVGNVTGAGSAVLHALTSYGNVNGKVIEAISTITVGANSTLTAGAGVDFILQSQGANNITLSAGASGNINLSPGSGNVVINNALIAAAGVALTLGTPNAATPMAVQLVAGSSTVTGNGADVTLSGGDAATSGNGGDILLSGGLAAGAGRAGQIICDSTLTGSVGNDLILLSQTSQNIRLTSPSALFITAATSIWMQGVIQAPSTWSLNLATIDDAAPQDVILTAGDNTGASGNGGNVSLYSGNADTMGNGGNITFNAGAGFGGGVSGKIFCNGVVTSTAAFNITTPNNNNLTLTTSGTGILSLLSDVPIRLNALAMGAVNGQILIGNTAAAFSLATLTAGANITITEGAGSITIASTGGSPGFPSVDYSGTARVITTADRATAIWFDDTSPSSSKTATLNYAPVFGETGLYIYNSAGNQNGLTILLDGGITAALEPPMPVIPPGGYAIITEGANGAGFPIFSVAIISNVGNVLSTLVNGITTTTQLLANNPANRVRIRNVLIEVVGTIVGPTSLNIVDSSANIYISIPVASLVTGTLVTASNNTFINATNYGNLISNKAISATFAGGAVASGSVNIDLEYVLA